MTDVARSRVACAQLDRADPLAPLRDQFQLPENVIYLDGNSLGPLPRTVGRRLQALIDDEWGQGLIRSWNSAGWIDAPRQIGDKIARLIGAGPGEVVVADSTSVNLFKALSAAIDLAARRHPARDRVILSGSGNFPTDAYIAASVASTTRSELRLVDPARIVDTLDGSISVLLLTHVDYRSGAMHDLAEVCTVARRHGVLTVWDLAHSAGAVEVDLAAAAADLAVGCGYKYLNGGPGAPAFVWVHPEHAGTVRQPLTGWMGHAAPFEFAPQYRPAPGIAAFQSGTPPVLSLAALECGLDTVLAAEPLGGMSAIRAKSIALGELFLRLVEPLCVEFGLTIASPASSARRGSQVSVSHPSHGYEIMQALIARGVIGDFRAPDILRFGFGPLYTRYVDIWDSVENLGAVLSADEWRDPRFATRSAVT